MGQTLNHYNPLLPTIITKPPAFDIVSVTAGVFHIRSADSSSGSRLDPALAPIDVFEDPPDGRASSHSQVLLRAICVLQHLQTVNAINNVNICQTHMYDDICVKMTIVKCK